MNEFSTRPHEAANEASAHKSADDGGNSPKGESTTAPRQSFWAKVARLLRPQNASSLREDLADVLATEESASIGFSPVERSMLNNILRFREVRVEDVMVPRAEIEAVDQDTRIGELMLLFYDTGRSRMPVYSETLDDPRGMVHIRDLLGYMIKEGRNKRKTASKPAAASVDGAASSPTPKPSARGAKPFDLSRVNPDTTIAEAGIIRPVLFVPPSMLASELMAKMQAERTQMALVIDEYGGTDGLASLEDIVEMLVGDIEDEHDDEEAMFTRQSDDVFVADARVDLEEISAAIGPDFDVSGQVNEVDTLGGLIFAELGRIPARGEVVQAVPGFEFHVLDADARRIKKVRIARKRAPARRRQIREDGEPENDATTLPENDKGSDI
ncbi:HlyC/CorC family transporter [Rhizobium sp. KVB221]|uniref:HlyC/CorC family transporter n=1 Tax=Rhizobium setariae TaxID=2801340 RepID=A0A936YQI1_9HYPH|nr:hemolysin family protein [Rhizobium setariae]MBL0372671.1 HlyC/CorC family transporter [Rhizobium setariae]